MFGRAITLFRLLGFQVRVDLSWLILALINALLAGFNLLPAFPLDGGRVLRSILWSMKDNLRWATRISAEIGAGFGLALIFLGVISVLMGNLIGGIWWFLIGLFLRNASNVSYRQLLVRQALEGEPARALMIADAITVPPNLSVELDLEGEGGELKKALEEEMKEGG